MSVFLTLPASFTGLGTKEGISLQRCSAEVTTKNNQNIGFLIAW